MGGIWFTLLGRFEARVDGRPLAGLESGKAVELLCYLLVFRDRPHHREELADLLWPESPSVQSRKYVRQALWHVQRAARDVPAVPGAILAVRDDWIEVDMASVDRIDVELLERAFLGLKDVHGEEIDDEQVAEAGGAVETYRGELLEGWYQDWCIFERERLKAIYLSLLEKLLASCERRRRYEAALAYGEMILRHERAHERTHARMMRLHFLAGNRTGAIRQFQACVASLEEELGVRPSTRTVALYERIRDDRQIEPPEQAVLPGIAEEPNPMSEARTTTEMVERLDDIGRSLSRVERLVERDIRAVHATARRDRRYRARPT